MSSRALFIYTHPSTFVKGDITILKKSYDVTEYCFINNPKRRLPLSLAGQFFYLLLNICRYDIVYIWFADYHSLLPVLFSRLTGKKCYLVIGGYDVCRERKYGYGSFSNKIRGMFAYVSIRFASKNLCVSKNIERIVSAIAPKSKHTTVYNGVNIKSEFDGTQEKEPVVLCVALVSTLQAFYIKGIDRYNDLAKEMGDTHFTLVGCKAEIFEKAGIKKAKNLRVVPALEHSKLALLMSKSKVYCQLSRRESFSLSLAEAMYHNCIPVITNTGGMPEVTGDLGYCITPDSPASTAFHNSQTSDPQNSANSISSERHTPDNLTTDLHNTANSISSEHQTPDNQNSANSISSEHQTPNNQNSVNSISSERHTSDNQTTDLHNTANSIYTEQHSHANQNPDLTNNLAEAVRKALEQPQGTAYRKRIEQNFTASHREQAIFAQL
jgi:glycosyltransferase involved in cell wall biosynthesis